MRAAFFEGKGAGPAPRRRDRRGDAVLPGGQRALQAVAPGPACDDKSMAFSPGIAVKENVWHHDLLVVGVEDDSANLAQSAAEIKEYLARRRCMHGLLVSPTHFRIYRNPLYPGTPDSVREVADIATPHITGPLPANGIRGPEFEDFVQRWLEKLQTDYLPRNISIPADVRDVVESEIVPSLYEGEIGATGSRWPWWIAS